MDVSPQGARGRNCCFAVVGCVIAGLCKHTFPHFSIYYYQYYSHYYFVHTHTLSPWWDASSQVFGKHRNMEGGLGIHTFSSAHAGGDWIVQPRLENAAALAALLPTAAPLSTLRVVSASRLSLPSADTDSSEEAGGSESGAEEEVEVVSCVWRAGRAGAATDHKAVMFDVDLSSSPNCPPGRIRPGFSNHPWYQLGGWWPHARRGWKGWWKWARLIDDGAAEGILLHPDTGMRLEGHTIPRMRQVMAP